MRNCIINFMDAVIIADEIWFFSNDYNALYSANIDSQEIVFRGKVPWEDELQDALFTAILSDGFRIFMIPFKATKIAIYDLKTREFTYIEVTSEEKKESQFYTGAYLYENSLFLYNFYYPKIIRVNVNTCEIVEIDSWVEELKPHIFDDNEIYFRLYPVFCKGKLFMPFGNANAVLQIDCETLTQKIYLLDQEKQGYAGMCIDGEDFWLVPRRANGQVVRWNPATHHMEKFQCPNNSNQIAYSGIIKRENVINIFSLVDLQCFQKDSVVQQAAYRCAFAKKDNNVHIMLDIDNNLLKLHFDVQKQVYEIPVITEYEKTPLKYAFSLNLVKESNIQTVHRLFEALEIRKDKPQIKNKRIGEEIYEWCKDTGEDKL